MGGDDAQADPAFSFNWISRGAFDNREEHHASNKMTFNPIPYFSSPLFVQFLHWTIRPHRDDKQKIGTDAVLCDRLLWVISRPFHR